MQTVRRSMAPLPPVERTSCAGSHELRPGKLTPFAGAFSEATTFTVLWSQE
jgi:hypothetical protein